MILAMFLEYFYNNCNIKSLVSVDAETGYTHSNTNLKMHWPLRLLGRYHQLLCLSFSNKFPTSIPTSMLTLLQSVKLLMILYMVTHVVASCLFLAVLQYDQSKGRHIHYHPNS